MKYEVKTTRLPKSEVEIEVSLPSDLFQKAKDKALETFKRDLELPGFRKGNAPTNIILENIGTAKLLEEAADILLKEHFEKIIEQENFDILGRPDISITKLAEGNPFEFKAKFALMPIFELPKYKEIAKSIKDKNPKETKVAEDVEIEKVLLQIRKNKAHMDWHKENKEDHHDHKDFDKEENLPPLDDQFAKEVGNFKDLSELKSKIKENILKEKEIKEVEKIRALIMEELVKQSKIDLPEILIISESEKSLAKMKDDIESMGGKWQDYLSHIKKEEEQIKNELRDSSVQKASIQLIFNKIAEVEKIEPNKEILENETKEILKHYPKADPINARVYVATILINQEVLRVLES